MKFLIVNCVLFALIAIGQCHPQTLPKKGCNVDGYFIEAGDELTVPGKCELVKCTGLNKAITSGCQEKSTEEKCFKKTPDTSKPFPDCCPQWICN